MLELGENIGFGPALNRAVAEYPADPAILLNNDVECGAALRRGAAGLARRGGPVRRRSAGAGTRAGADRLRRRGRRPHADGLRLPARRADSRPPRTPSTRSARPAAPRSTGARRSRRSAASTSASSSTTRTSTWRCGWPRPARSAGSPLRRGRCTPTRPASAPRAAAKFARTGWSRGYMLRRYGVMSQPAPWHCGRSPARARSAPARCCSTAAPPAPAAGCAAGGTAPAWASATSTGAALLDISAREALALRRRRHTD